MYGIHIFNPSYLKQPCLKPLDNFETRYIVYRLLFFNGIVDVHPLTKQSFLICRWSVWKVKMLGVNFFDGFHLEGEPFPKFEQSKNWLNIKILNHNQDSTEESKYHSHLQAIDKAFKSCKATSSKRM